MGCNVSIYFELKSGDVPEEFEIRWKKMSEPNDDFPKATHMDDMCLLRFYAPGYERGPWPIIGGSLLSLLADPDVGVVYYSPDGERSAPLTLEGWHKINRHYIENQDRPYWMNMNSE